MQAIDKIRDRTKPLQLTKTPASIFLNTKIYQVPVTNSCTNIFFSRFSSSIIKTVTPTPRHLKEKEV